MASVPPSQRRTSPSARSGSSSQHSSEESRVSANECATSTSEARPALSKDERVLLTPTQPSPTTDAVEQTPAPQSSSPETQTSHRPSPVDLNDMKRCWICFADETEDTPTTSRWRSPCPCALVAHESCILDWVADMEAPSSRSNAGRKKRVLCPQCKNEITIARPRSVIVDVVRAIEHLGHRLLWPTILTLGGTTAIYLSLSYGSTAAHMVLGSADFELIFLAPMDNNGRQLAREVLGLAAVPWMLIFSRTSIADSFMPILPMMFIATAPNPESAIDFSRWPPSASLSFALLPYVRIAYNALYDRIWAEQERKWLAEIQPRASGDNDGNGENGDAAMREDGIMVGVEIDEIIEDPLEDQQQNNNQEDNGAHPLHAPPLDQGQDNGNAPAAAGGQAGANNGQRHNVVQHRRRFDRPIGLESIAQSVIGALAFPAISSFMGDLLRTVLPTSWTYRGPGESQARRMLQTRWGRSIVGGCLFVVLKDAVTLYVRWKMAKNHRRRSVLDWVGRRK